MIRVVLDSNILVSAALWEESPPAQVLDLVRHDHRFQLTLSDHILNEVRRILLSRKLSRFFGVGIERNAFVEEYVGRLRASSIMVRVSSVVRVIHEDPPDNMVLACALDGSAQFLITGNERHLNKLVTWHGIRILKAADFLAMEHTLT